MTTKRSVRFLLFALLAYGVAFVADNYSQSPSMVVEVAVAVLSLVGAACLVACVVCVVASVWRWTKS